MIPRFSIIIPTFNRRETLERCLGSLARQEGGVADAEVIVVDDGSTDGTAQGLEGRTFPFALTCIRTEKGGPGRARNAGAAIASGAYLSFTEDDVVPDTTWLAAARRHLAGGGTDVLEGRTVQEGSRRGIRRFEPVPGPSFIPCNLFIRRDLFRDIGGYDGEFFDRNTGLYFREDADLGFRILERGGNVVLAGDLTVEHPSQFPDLAACLRHVRRYTFDPLLYRKHPALYRRLIEVKTFGGIVVRRPMHYASLAFCLLGSGGVAAAALGHAASIPLLAGAFLCSWLIRYKYQGSRALRLHDVRDTLGFCLVPMVYLASLLGGCRRFHSYGALL